MTHRLQLKNCDAILCRLLFKEINYACKLYIAEMKLLSVVNCTINWNSNKDLQHTTHVDWSAVIRAVFNGCKKFPIAIKFGNPITASMLFILITSSWRGAWSIDIHMAGSSFNDHTTGAVIDVICIYGPVTCGMIDLIPIWKRLAHSCYYIRWNMIV